MGKYLELFRGEVGDLTEKTKLENKPYVAYSTKEGRVTYTVVPKEEPIAPISYETVDLGLPSGLKWADRLVGSSAPGEPGLYFQWGDTIGYTKEQVEAGEKVFDWDSYWDTNDGGHTFNKYNNEGGKTVLDLEDDAAHTHMGSDWRMPTYTEFQELINNTTPTFIDLQGNEFTQAEAKSGSISKGNFKGVRLTGLNGNSIFIPACGSCYMSLVPDISYYGNLWSSSLYENNSSYGRGLNSDHNGGLSGDDGWLRSAGVCVLGVKA